MFISKDLNKKCYVVTNIAGDEMLDRIMDEAYEVLSRDGYLVSADLYGIIKYINIDNSYIADPCFGNTHLKSPVLWYSEYIVDDTFALYVPYYDESKSNNTPDISSIKTYNDRAVLVRFKDGTFTKAVAMDKDPFDFDMLFTIAYMKRMLGEDGHKKYHKLIDKAHKILNNQEKAKIKDINDKEKLQAKKKKMLDKNNKKSKEADDRISKLIHDAVLSAFADSVKPTYIPNTEDDLK